MGHEVCPDRYNIGRSGPLAGGGGVEPVDRIRGCRECGFGPLDGPMVYRRGGIIYPIQETTNRGLR